MASSDEIEIVLNRLEMMPSNLKVSIGSAGSFTREELIEEIKNNTHVGELVVEAHMVYLRSFKHRQNILNSG